MGTLQNMIKFMILIVKFRMLEKYTMYQKLLCRFWKNLSGHFPRSPLNHSYGYASTGDQKNWLTEIPPKFCIPMKYSG